MCGWWCAPDGFRRGWETLSCVDVTHGETRVTVERGGCSTLANSTSDNSTSASWPKSKLAEVEINWPKSNRWCLLCFFIFLFFFFCFLVFFYFLFLFLVLTLHFVLTLNPEPCTPNRWTTLRWRQPCTGQPSAGLPKISLFFFPSPATVFILLSLSWGPFVEFWWCFLKAGTLKCPRLGSRAVV